MKQIKYLILFLSTIFFFTSCEKETEGVSGIVRFKLLGDETMLVKLGTSYQEPGCEVIYRGEDITKTVQITGDVNGQVVGLYAVNYTYTNPDGIKTTISRKVIVADPTVTTDISGQYITATGTYRIRGGVRTDYPGFKVTITKIAPGFFQISDFLGGYYDQRATYGPAYATSGFIQLKSDNSISLLSSSNTAWKDALTDLTEASCSPSNNTVTWKADYAGMIFTVILNKK